MSLGDQVKGLKDHEIQELTNALRDSINPYIRAQCLREMISSTILTYLQDKGLRIDQPRAAAVTKRVFVWPDLSWLDADDYEDVVEAWRGDDYNDIDVPLSVTDDKMDEYLAGRDCCGDGLILALTQEVDALRQKIEKAKNCLVCLAIAPAVEVCENTLNILDSE